jgi:hypothetical protein
MKGITGKFKTCLLQPYSKSDMHNLVSKAGHSAFVAVPEILNEMCCNYIKKGFSEILEKLLYTKYKVLPISHGPVFLCSSRSAKLERNT